VGLDACHALQQGSDRIGSHQGIIELHVPLRHRGVAHEHGGHERGEVPLRRQQHGIEHIRIGKPVGLVPVVRRPDAGDHRQHLAAKARNLVRIDDVPLAHLQPQLVGRALAHQDFDRIVRPGHLLRPAPIQRDVLRQVAQVAERQVRQSLLPGIVGGRTAGIAARGGEDRETVCAEVAHIQPPRQAQDTRHLVRHVAVRRFQMHPHIRTRIHVPARDEAEQEGERGFAPARAPPDFGREDLVIHCIGIQRHAQREGHDDG